MISIIIPVYNVESYIRKCLASLKNQTYKNLEFIIINDGSKDNSMSICKEYANQDKRFIIINKENGGVSSARNLGLKNAKGEYISFVDPDDWIELDMFEKLIDLIKQHNADISSCGYFKETINGKLLNNVQDDKTIELTRAEALNHLLDEDKYKGFLWNKLFSRELINFNEEDFFDKNIHFCEDLLFVCKCILESKKMVYTTTSYYHYIIHNTNICGINYSKKKLTALTALEKIIDLLKNKENININKYKNLYMHMNISLLMHGINNNECTKDEYKILKNNLYKNKIKDLNDKSVKLSCLLGRINTNLLYLVWKKTINKYNK